MAYMKINNSDLLFLIDNEDVDLISRDNWFIHPKGYIYATPYVGNYKQKQVKLHRIIMDAPDNLTVDHINHDKLDNRKINLRLCTIIENNFNRRSKKNSSSRFKGVGWNKKASKWQAEISANGVRKYIGMFDNENDAALAYNNFAVKFHGQFAVLNYVGDN